MAACGSASSSAGSVQTSPSRVLQVPGGRPAHVAVLVMENEEFGDVIGSRAGPFINSLARQYALARNLYAVSHPSLPNYLALTGGSRFGIPRACSACAVRVTSLVCH